jgi:hypothetical protein
MVVLAVLTLSSVIPTPASAASHRQSADPSPQKAPPSSSSSAPAPDPAPQAAVRSQPTHSTPPATLPSHATAPATPRSVPAVVAPRIVHASAPARTSPTAVAQVSTVNRAPQKPHTHTPGHPAAKVSHAPPRHHAAARRTESQPIAISLPAAFLLKDILRLPHAALHAGEDVSHRGGVLLLLSSLAMGLLAVSSFSLLRRLRRLEVGS